MEGKASEVSESRLRQKALAGLTATGHAGIGYLPATRVDKAKGMERQHLVQEKVRADVKEA